MKEKNKIHEPALCLSMSVRSRVLVGLLFNNPVTSYFSPSMARVTLIVKTRSASPQHPGSSVPLAAQTLSFHPLASRSYETTSAPSEASTSPVYDEVSGSGDARGK